MFVQHMLAVTRPGGMVTTVMPHGVLFRGGDEGRIRTGFLDDDLIEAVIGLGPHLFYGTGIPACIPTSEQRIKALQTATVGQGPDGGCVRHADVHIAGPRRTAVAGRGFEA